MTKNPDPAVDDTIKLFGSRAATCAALGVSTQAITNWRREGMPPARRLQVIRILTDREVDIPKSLLCDRDSDGAVPDASIAMVIA